MRRVVVTGIGVVSALGPDRHAFWEALVGGRSGVGPFVGLDPSGLRCRVGAQVQAFETTAVEERTTLASYDRFARLALCSARQAVEQAGWQRSEKASHRTAVVTGNCSGGVESEDDGYRAIYRYNRPRVSPTSIPRIMANAGASLISFDLGSRGPTYNVSTACASSAHALGQAFMLVRSGVAERAVAGGSEAPFSLPYLMAWDALRVMAPTACRPFSRGREGMVLGEAGAMLTLETLDAARSRGIPALAEIVGFSMTSDAGHVTRGDSDVAAATIRIALADAGISP